MCIISGARLEDSYIDMFSRQILVDEIGVKGQMILRGSKVAVTGAGAVGSSVAELLARMGVGYIRIIDRDIVDLSNISRCHMLEYSDYLERKPKALAVAEKISRITPFTKVEPVMVNIDSGNILDIVRGVDLVIDGLDSLEAKHLVNEATVMARKPYIYVGIEGAYGTVIPVIPGETACLRCVVREHWNLEAGCDVIGTNILAVTMASTLAVSLAIKILTGRKIYGGVYYIDASSLELKRLDAKRSPSCPTCSLGRYELVGRRSSDKEVLEICGTPGAYIASPTIMSRIDKNNWYIERRGPINIYRRKDIEIIEFSSHLLIFTKHHRKRIDDLMRDIIN
jgi:adenylyltransferase/sulfurtransferase